MVKRVEKVCSYIKGVSFTDVEFLGKARIQVSETRTAKYPDTRVTEGKGCGGDEGGGVEPCTCRPRLEIRVVSWSLHDIDSLRAKAISGVRKRGDRKRESGIHRDVATNLPSSKNLPGPS